MSKSRSTTPKPNTIPTNITPSSESTTSSRIDSHEHTPSATFTVGGEQQSTSRLSHFHSLLPLSPETSQRTSALVRPSEEDSKDQPMAKRFRRGSPQTLNRPTEKSSSSSNSQDDMEDTEMDDKPNHQSEPLAPAVPPPKKKRTRTLTTPHQSAVLHALLAQSRFPTTAMREEVGRSIGLSARKVQIWFQNQRQKARRPRSQSDVSRRRFPQYGPFPSGPETAAPGSFSVLSEQGSSFRTGQMSYTGGTVYPVASDYHSSDSYSGSLESPAQLLGPGMPGSESQPDVLPIGLPAMIQRPDAALERYPPSSPPYANPRADYLRLSSPRLQQNVAINRPRTTSRSLDRGFSRTLPPLVFNPVPTRSSFTASGPSAFQPAPPTDIPPRFFKRSKSPEVTFAHQPPEVSFSSRLPVPPPYALQPRPQWDSSTTFGPMLRSSDSPSWSRQVSHPIDESPTPPGPSGGKIESTESGDVVPADSVPSQRSGRYDPVRATFVYTTGSSSSQRRSPSDTNDLSRQIDKHED